MAKEITAVQCAACKTLHPITSGYIHVTATIIEHKDQDNTSYQYNKREKQSVMVTDEIVCDNTCLANLLSLKLD